MEKQLYKDLSREFEKQYAQLYNFQDKYPTRRIKGYHIALAYWDKFFEDYKELVSDFVEERQDLLTSDRECVAFLFAVEKLGLWGK